jgi:DNA invertase Pin-like site-specific DNA recombinase
VTDDERPKIGYARVSTCDQKLDLQMDALTKCGVDPEWIYTDKVSGSSLERPGLRRALKAAGAGDTLVIWKLDRLGRSLYEVVGLLERLEKRDIKLVSITENLDARTPMGKAMIHILAAMAQLERDLIIERTKAGQAASRERGRVPGRRDKMTAEIEAEIVALLSKMPPLAMNEIAALLKGKISRTKFFNWMRDNPDKVRAARKDKI